MLLTRARLVNVMADAILMSVILVNVVAPFSTITLFQFSSLESNVPFSMQFLERLFYFSRVSITLITIELRTLDIYGKK
jgi:hypothetical protein